jgi:hypothetical protein
MAFSMGLMGLVSGVLAMRFNLFFMLIPLLFGACIAIPVFTWKGPVVRPILWRGLASFLLVGLVGPCAALLGVALASRLLRVVYHPTVNFFPFSVFTWPFLIMFLVVMLAPGFIWALFLSAAAQTLTGTRDEKLILAISIGTEFVSLGAFVLGYLLQSQIASQVVIPNSWVIGELLVSGVLLGMSFDRRMGAVQY